MCGWFFNPRGSVLLLILCLWTGGLQAQEPIPTVDSTSSSTLVSEPKNPWQADSMKSRLPRKMGLMGSVIRYFAQSNQPKNHRKLDFSVIGGPHYSTDTRLGLGLIAAGLYYTSPTDSLLPPSNLSLYADVSTVGFYMVGLKGVHLSPHERFRLSYDASFVFFPTKFWGVGYDLGNDGGNESRMNRSEVDVQTHFLFRLGPGIYLGPSLSFNWMRAAHLTRPELLPGGPAHAADVGAGATFQIDTRDVMTAPHRGFYLSLSQMLRRQLSNARRFFFTTTFTASTYRPLWRGSTLALQAGGVLQFGSLEWNNMALLGNSHAMRGYYGGRYRDHNKLEAQAELRQHVYRRNGLVAWIGAGTVFPKLRALRLRHILPNWGIGYRWEFKKNVNIRLDYGMGKSGQSGFLFNVNEAF